MAAVSSGEDAAPAANNLPLQLTASRAAYGANELQRLKAEGAALREDRALEEALAV